QLHVDKKDYEGFFTRPASWETIIHKFKTLTTSLADERKLTRIIEIVKDLEKYKIRELMNILVNPK
ncbi:MAG: hypothetical protein ACRDE2_01375, partial [Chitinophagaceae bacterium]